MFTHLTAPSKQAEHILNISLYVLTWSVGSAAFRPTVSSSAAHAAWVDWTSELFTLLQLQRVVARRHCLVRYVLHLSMFVLAIEC
jgi:hypothetical protein